MTMRQLDISLILTIDTIATLCSLQIYIGHLRILAYRFPEHLALIVRKVNTMHMVAGIFALQIRVEIRVSSLGSGIGSNLAVFFLLRFFFFVTLWVLCLPRCLCLLRWAKPSPIAIMAMQKTSKIYSFFIVNSKF